MNMKMEYQKPVIEVLRFQQVENIMVSATAFGLVVDDGWFKPIA